MKIRFFSLVAICFLFTFSFVNAGLGGGGSSLYGDSSKGFLISKMGTLGESLNAVLRNSNIIYIIYFFAFFFLVFTVINFAFQREFFSKSGSSSFGQFKGKPGKVIAFIISLFATGSVFFGKTTKDLVDLFNGFGGFLLALIGAGAIFGMGIHFFNKLRKENFNFAMFILAFVCYISAAIMLPQFWETTNGSVAMNYYGDKSYIYSAIGVSGGIFYNFFNYMYDISSLLMFLFGILALIDFFKAGDSKEKSKTIADKAGLKDDGKKTAKEIEKIVKGLAKEFKGYNEADKDEKELLKKMRDYLRRKSSAMPVQSTRSIANQGGNN